LRMALLTCSRSQISLWHAWHAYLKFALLHRISLNELDAIDISR
jgi:hypothetical protein